MEDNNNGLAEAFHCINHRRNRRGPSPNILRGGHDHHVAESGRVFIFTDRHYDWVFPHYMACSRKRYLPWEHLIVTSLIKAAGGIRMTEASGESAMTTF